MNRLINRRLNGMVKVITGLRRSEKSFLLFNLYRSYLNSIGVDDAHIIEVALDDADNYVYHNPRKLLKYIRSKIVDSAEYYIFIDEIQFVKSVKVKDPEIKNGSVIQSSPKGNIFRLGEIFTPSFRSRPRLYLIEGSDVNLPSLP